jgi:hypothetical protein
MKFRPIVKNLVVLVTIMVFSVFTFSVPANLSFKGKKKKNQYGQVEVTASAEQAAVFIEGFNMGTSPLTIEDVPPGTYRITVKAAGYDDFIEDIKVEKQQVSKVDARMTAGGEAAKLPHCDYNFWDSLSKNEKSNLEKPRYSSLLLGYQNIEVANFDLKINSKKPLPHHLLFPFYANMIKQLDKQKDFPQIIVGYTDIEGIEEVKKVLPRQQAAAGEKTLLLSGVVKKLKDIKNKNQGPAPSFSNLQVSKNVSISTSVFAALIKNSPQIAILFRLTDKETNYVVYNQLISGSIYTVGEEFAKALKDAVDTLRKREKEKETGH